MTVASLPAVGATISGSLTVLSPRTGKEISNARVGEEVKARIFVNDLNLIANKNIAVTYVLSVLPTGSNTPVTLSGKLAGAFTLPEGSGGAPKTKKDLASFAGGQTASQLLIIPDFMPAGKATLTITLSGNGVGSINLSKMLNIQL